MLVVQAFLLYVGLATVGGALLPYCGNSPTDVLLTAVDDECPINFTMTSPLPMFGVLQTIIYVCTNGIITTRAPFHEYVPVRFPMWTGGSVIIAPFWADFYMASTGSLCARYVTSGTELADVGQLVSEMIQANFMPTSMVVATWNDVTVYGSTDQARSLFQAVVITDGVQAYSVFNYGYINWSASTSMNHSASVGVDGGKGRDYYTVPQSLTENIGNMGAGALASNVARPGMWIFPLNAPLDACTAVKPCGAANLCTAGSNGTYTCHCSLGFTAAVLNNAATCSNVDECSLGISGCGPDSTCFDTIGSFTCKCNPGFQADGVICNDVDECSLGTNNCSLESTCMNTFGGYSCTCDDGFQGDGIICIDVDECSVGISSCSPDSTCTNTVGGYFCECADGFHGDGFICIDVDECSLATNNCSPDSTCTNTIGGYFCKCDDGFQFNGTVCIDVDECSLGTSNCSPDSTCTNTVGSFRCTCNDGFKGDGIICNDVDECSSGTQCVCCPAASRCVNAPGGFECRCVTGFQSDGLGSCIAGEV